MIKMKGKQKNNLNISKDMSLNLKISSNNNNTFFKTNNISLDFASSPIKNNKKVIKRNTRTNSYNSFINNQTENYKTNKNPFNSGIISFDSKINLKKNIFTFSNAKQTIFCNSKNNNNFNQKKNKNKTKNITAHQSTSNLAKYNINLNTDNNSNLKNNNNNSNDYINMNTNPNITSSFILNKKNQKSNNNNNHVHNHFHNFIKDNNFYSFSLQEKTEKEKEKVYFRNMNNTSKNLLFLTRPNYNSTKFQGKNKTSLYKNCKEKTDDLITNKNYLDFNYRGINSNPKSQKNIKNINTKTTKNSKEKRSNKNMNRMSGSINNNIINFLELSTEKQKNEFLNEYELLYNCLKKRNEVYKNYNKECRSKSGRKNKRRKKNIMFDEEIFNQDSLLDILYENKQIRLKNEELSKKFESIKIEFEQMKKDNNDIKEELKEKTKYLKDIKLTMDIFSQELLKLQTIYNNNDDNKDNKDNNKDSKDNNKVINSYKSNSNLSLKENKEDNKEKENQKKIIEMINNKNNNNKVTINNNNIKKNGGVETETESNNNYIINTDVNNYTCEIDKNDKNSLQKNKKMEKIHQLSLNNINNLMNQQNRKRGNSSEANNFQDTSKIINNETKDATEKENECLNDKWPSPLYLEKKEKEKEVNNEINKEDEESIDITNISLADNLNINEEMYKNALNIKKNNIGKLDFENKLIRKNEDNDKVKKIPKNLNLINQEVANDNFNEEFLKYYDKFSDSWRKEVDKMLKKGKE